MKMVATRLLNYNPSEGLYVKKQPIMQFLYTSATPFGNLLYPVKPVVQLKKDHSTMFDLVYSDKYDDLISSSNQVLGETVKIEKTGLGNLGVKHSGNILKTEDLNDLEINKSVFALGVSLDESVKYRDKLMSLGVPVFVYLDTRGYDLLEILELIGREYTSITGFYYVVKSDLEFKSNMELLDGVSKESWVNVRLIGENVLKLRGENNCGMFPLSVVNTYGLEFDYVDNTHPCTQVAYSLTGFEKGLISSIPYPQKKTGVKKVVQMKPVSSTSEGVSPSVKTSTSTKKPTKKKLSRLELFGG